MPGFWNLWAEGAGSDQTGKSERLDQTALVRKWPKKVIGVTFIFTNRKFLKRIVTSSDRKPARTDSSDKFISVNSDVISPNFVKPVEIWASTVVVVVVTFLSGDGKADLLCDFFSSFFLFFCFVSLPPFPSLPNRHHLSVPPSICEIALSDRQIGCALIRGEQSEPVRVKGRGLVPLQDNYNLVAATATLSPTSLPTHTQILLIGLKSRRAKRRSRVFRGLADAALKRGAAWGDGGRPRGKTKKVWSHLTSSSVSHGPS